MKNKYVIVLFAFLCFAAMPMHHLVILKKTAEQAARSQIKQSVDNIVLHASEFVVPLQLMPTTERKYSIVAIGILTPLFGIIFILFLYVVRHSKFAFNRLFGKQYNPYAEIIEAAWPKVSILIAAHNEETVISDILLAVLKIDYPKEQLQVIVVNDRSTDETGRIVDEFVHHHPGRFIHFYRQEGTPGKGAALVDAMAEVKGDIVLIFDADYVPGQFLIKELVCPFFDPEVGSVMGRVVPGNTRKNLLTRLIDLERTGGYQVNQQARENLHAVPQYGGTSGGIRAQALKEVGSWNAKYLAEDTEITFRLLCAQWKTVYQNNAECIELVPETWPVRIRQIKRWAKGHNQVMFRYLPHVLRDKRIGLSARIDAVFLLFTFLISPLLLLGWVLFLLTYFLDISPGSSDILGFLIIISFSGVGNFTIFYEIATAVHLDNLRNVEGSRIRLLPLIYLNFLVNMFVISAACLEQITIDRFRKTLVWHRTDHPSRVNTAR